MKKLRFVVLFLCVAFNTAKAQTTFRINYDVALFDLPVNATEALTPNNYVFSGFHNDILPIRSSLTQLNDTGGVVWAKRFSDNSLSFMFGDFKRDNALNRYYVCGGSDNGPAFLMFVDAAGNLLSGRRFTISEADGAFFNKVIKTSDGGYLCVGYVIGYDPDGAGGEVKFSPVTHTPPECTGSKTEIISSPLIVKFDPSGIHQWHRVFRYYTGSVAIANRIYNDASFVDVVEVSDGYIAIGNYDVNNVFSVYDTGSGNSCGEDRTPTDAMFLKTDPSGNILWHRQIDSPSNSTSQPSKSLTSISKTATGLPIISGTDDAGGTTRPCLLMRLPGSGTTWSNPTWIRRVGGAMLIPLIGPYAPLIPNRIFETSDGDYAVWSNYFPSLSFSNLLFKINPSNNAFAWARQHTFNFASILPYGEQVSDGGYIGVSYNLAGSGHDLHFIKTDVNGNAPTTCAATNVTLSSDAPSYTWANPIYQSWNIHTVTNTTITPTVANITPNRTVQCIQTACTPPPAPTTVTATPNPICAGSSTTITASGGGSGNTYNVFANPTGGTALGATPFTVSPASTTTYYVETVSGSDPTCVSTTRTAVTVTVTPLNTVSGPVNQTLCVNVPLSPAITHTTTGATGIGAATGLPAGLTASFNSNTITISGTPTATGTFNYSIPLTGGCGTVNATGTITVISVNTVTGPFTNSVCVNVPISPAITHTTSGATGIGAATGLPAGVTATWNANTITISGTPTATGTFNYTIPLTGGCGTVSATGTITVISVNTVTGPVNATACVGTAISPAITHTTSGATGIGAATGLPAGITATWNANTITINGIPTATGTFNYTIPLTGGCGTVNATGTITVNPTPSPVITGDTLICSGETTVLSTGTFSTYNWSNGGQTQSISVSPTSNTTYTVSVTDANGCSGTASVNVTVNPLPIVNISGSTSICNGQSTTLTATGGGSYQWSNGDNTASITVNPAVPTSYTVVVTNNSGCTDSATVNVSVFQQPTAQITGNSNMCSGQIYTLTASGGNNYLWNTGDTTSTINVSTSVDTVFIVTVSNGSCSASDTFNVTVSSNPTANAGTDVTINQTQTATLTATGGGTYLWTPAAGLDCDTCATVNAKPIETTTYCVTVIDANACRDSACVIVTLDFICGEIFVPTIFSPNDDGNNDNLCVLGNCVQTLSFTIYSRWGEKVFETTDPRICWDGTYKGKIMNTGAFVYVLEATLTDGTTVQEKGNFTLVR